MDTTTIWVSVVIPIIIGPLFLLIKMMYDRYIGELNEKKIIVFNEKKTILKDKLDNFYWPLYLKLLCIYQLNYNLPEDSDGSSSSSQESEDEYDEKRVKCIGYIKDRFYSCNKYISRENKYMLCKRCNKMCNKFNINKKNNKKLLLKRENIGNIIINIPDNEESELDLMYENEFSDNSPDITGNGVGVVNELNYTTLNINKDTLEKLEKQLLVYYLDCDKIIQSNINICNPSNKLGKQLIKFVKYINVRSIINSQNFSYNTKQFGCKNNLNKVISLVELLLYNTKDEYDKLLEDGPYELTE